MYGQSGSGAWGRRMLLAGLLPLLVLGSLLFAAPAAARSGRRACSRERPAREHRDGLPAGRQPRLRAAGHGAGRGAVPPRAGQREGLLWSARFVSRWALTDDQLDRWSAQVIGLLTDELSGTCAWVAGSA